MKNSILIVGEKFKHLSEFTEYLTRQVLLHIDGIDNFIYLKENDPEILVEMESVIEKSTNLFIVASGQSFSLVGKMLSTYLGDSLTVKGELLIPSKASVYAKDSYLVEMDGRFVNVLKVDEAKEIPEILINRQNRYAFLNVFGFDEESAQILLSPIAQANDVSLQSFRHIGDWSIIRAECKKYGNISNFISGALNLLPNKTIAGRSVIVYLIERLKKDGKTLTAAESCTGGLISSLITSVSGSSDVFNGSVVTYSNEIKESWLGIDMEEINAHGAVSSYVVEKMLEGALGITKADFCIATSGIAGPLGGSTSKPVGTVYVGVKAVGEEARVERLFFEGDRNHIQISSAYAGIRMLTELILQK